LGSLDDENLRQVRAHAKKLDISVEIGMRSCCPTSKMFDPEFGTAEEQLIRMLNAARTIGSPIVRTVLGSAADRDPTVRPPPLFTPHHLPTISRSQAVSATVG
jgi:hypothetical protein